MRTYRRMSQRRWRHPPDVPAASSDCAETQKPASHFFRALATTLWLVAALLISPLVLAQDGPEITFDRQQGLISLHAVDVPLGELMDAIGEATDIEILKQGKHATPVTIDLVDAPLKTALTDLLGGGNYTMQQDPRTQRPVKIWLMSSVDQHVIDRMREAQRQAAERDRTSVNASVKKSPTAGDVPPSLLSDQQRQELRELRQSVSEKEVFAELGLNEEQQERFSQLLDELEADGGTLLGLGLSEEQNEAFLRMLDEIESQGIPLHR